MADHSPPPTGTMTGGRQSTVLRVMAGVGGGMGAAPMPILMVCTTTYPGPQISLGFGGTGGIIVIIP